MRHEQPDRARRADQSAATDAPPVADSAIARRDIDSLAAALTAGLASTRLQRRREGGRSLLVIPGHRPFPWSPPRFNLFRPHLPRFYEETTTVLLSFLLDRFRPAVFYDVGAESGYFSRVAASFETAPPRVHAFEMRPSSFEAMQRALVESGQAGRVAAHLSALSDEHRGERDVWFARTRLYESEPDPRDYRESWWVTLRSMMLLDRTRGLRHARVLLTTIDRFAADNAAPPDLLKIDVDGYEGKVLTGAAQTLASRRPPLILELHKDRMQRDGYTRRRIVDLLFDHGYRALFLTDHHSLATCEVVPAERASPLFARQETDLVLFV